jgi:hypothetical protein
MVYRISFLIGLILYTMPVLCQVTELEENKVEMLNGIEYGYYIKNEQQKNIKDEAYSRFEITLNVSNKSGCTKIYTDRGSLQTGETASLLATFNCVNANGKRLTAKGGSIKAKEFYINAKVQENGKEVTRAAKAGYIFRNNETLTANIIVLVPNGERPKMQYTVNTLTEL